MELPDAPADLSPPFVTRARFVKGATYPVYAGGVRWFPRLANDKTADGRVSAGAMSVHTANATILSWELPEGPGIPRRVFACFANALDAFDFVQSVIPEERCLFEVCTSSRKLFFDVDISGEVAQQAERFFETSAAEVGERVVRALIEGVVEVAAQHGVPIEARREFRLYESHGPAKRSYHLVLQRACQTAASAKAWYHAVLASQAFAAFRDFPAIGSIVDASVYSTTQQLRLLGGQKSGSGRVKGFRPSIPTGQGEVPLILPGLRSPPLVFCESLASGRAPALPDLAPTAPARKRAYGSDLPPAVCEAALDLAARHGEFDSVGSEGSLLFLQRRGPSLCPTCGVYHESENPFLVLVERNGGWDVRFDCRRSESHGGKRTTCIGFVPAEVAAAAAEREEHERPLYREASVEFEFEPSDEDEAPALPPPKNIAEWLARTLVPKPGEVVACSQLKDEALAYFGDARPEERGFRVGGNRGSVPTLADAIVAGGKRHVTKRRVQGTPRDVVLDHCYVPLPGGCRSPKAAASAWSISPTPPRKPFSMEAPCLRDVAVHDELFARSPVVVLRGPMGVGKTRLVVAALAAVKRSVLIAESRTLLRDNEASLIRAGARTLYYENFLGGVVAPRADEDGCLVICIDSVHKINFAATGWRPELVVVDECESVFASLTERVAQRDCVRCDKALQEQREAKTCSQVLESLLASTPRVVLSDAAADQETLDYLRRFRKEALPLHLDRVPSRRTATAYETHAQLERFAFDLVEREKADGAAVVFHFGSVDEGRLVIAKARAAGHTVALITADGVDADLPVGKTFSEIAAAGHDILAYSPCVGPGCSHTPEDGGRPYRHIVAFLTPASAPSSTAAQALFRIRAAEHIHFSVAGTHGSSVLPPTARTIADVRAWLAEAAVTARRVMHSAALDAVTGDLTPYGALFAKSQLIKRASSTKAGFEADLVRRLAENGVEILPCVPEADTAARRTIEGVREAAQAAQIQRLVAVDINSRPEQYSREERDRAAAEEVASLADIAPPPSGEFFIPREVAERAVRERWVEMHRAFKPMRVLAPELPSELPAALGASLREVQAFCYVQNFSRLRTLHAMRAALPPTLPLAKFVGATIDHALFEFLPERNRQKAVERLFAHVGVTVESWTVTASVWAEGWDGRLRVGPF